jgi:predicted histidine transporter YuiF (NhaC family)
MTLQEIITALIVPVIIFVTGMSLHLFFQCRKETRELRNRMNGYPKAKSMSRADKKELNRLLDEHETKIS